MNPPHHRGWHRLAATLSFMAFLFACIFGVFGLYAAKLELLTAPAMGHVVQVTMHPDGSTVPTIAFVAPDGSRHAFGGLEHDGSPWRVGEAVGVRFDPERPDYAHADDALSRWWFQAALVVAATVLAIPHCLMRRKSAVSTPIFHRQPDENMRLSALVWADQGGTRSLRQLYVTDRRIVLGRIRVARLVAHLVLAIVAVTQLLSLVPAAPAGWCFPAAIAALLGVAYRFSRSAPIVQEHPLTSIVHLKMTASGRWVSQGLIIAFADAEDWILRSSQKHSATARPYADRIAAVSGRTVEG